MAKEDTELKIDFFDELELIMVSFAQETLEQLTVSDKIKLGSRTKALIDRLKRESNCSSQSLMTIVSVFAGNLMIMLRQELDNEKKH